MADDRQGSFQDGQRPAPRAPQGGNGAGPGPRELDRLPPPAFPPGRGAQPARVRRSAAARRTEGEGGEGEGGVPDEAFISPDEPIVRSGTRIAPGAFISPDEPLPARDDDDIDSDEGMVTGIGDDPHLGDEDLAFSRYSDPHVADLVLRVGRLADALRDKGEAGLRTTADMSRFEATLRAYCVGYLAAQRDTKSE